MSRRRRPFTPPALLIWLKAVSMPIFIWRPSSRDAPLNGAAIPNKISASLTPRTALSGELVCAGGGATAVVTIEEAVATSCEAGDVAVPTDAAAAAGAEASGDGTARRTACNCAV